MLPNFSKEEIMSLDFDLEERQRYHRRRGRDRKYDGGIFLKQGANCFG